MNKTKIKNFSIWARRNLIEVVAYRMRFLGIDENGIKAEMQGSSDKLKLYDMGTTKPAEVAGDDISKRNRLVNKIRDHERTSDYKTAYETIVEEIAYTWFNRLIAIRFMEVNGYLPSGVRVLSSESGKSEPDIVTQAVEVAEDQGFPITKEEIWKLKDENKLDELFRVMFIRQCKKLSEVLPELFDSALDDYTELLLPISFIDNDGFIRRLVTDIDEADFNVSDQGQVEIIGWLYQYYNSEKKDAVFAAMSKNVKVSKENIAAATQLFTPDWIVRYMVENSLGRLWTDGHPDTSAKSEWKYYLEEAEQTEEVNKQLAEIRASRKDLTPEQILFIDPCMGSGHILIYAFDVLMQIYVSCGYSEKDAAQKIVKYNLWGLDLDKRAYQLAYFAVIMKARQYDRRFLSRIAKGEIKPNLAHFQDLPRVDTSSLKEPIKSFVQQFDNADTYGSLISVTADDKLDEAFDNFSGTLELNFATIDRLMVLYRILSQKYDVVCTNPPYMRDSGMNGLLSEYVKKYYSAGKSDLFACFMEKCRALVNKTGFYSMITMHSWMFLSSFEELREKLNKDNAINMIHLGARAFDEISGEVVQTTSFVNRIGNINDYKTKYIRLIREKGEAEKEKAFFEEKNEYIAANNKFSVIPGSPIAYWWNESILNCFGSNECEFGNPMKGIQTGKGELFIRFWFEVSLIKIGLNLSKYEDIEASNKKWFPLTSGGLQRRWYGNFENVANLEHNGLDIRSLKNNNYRLKNPDYYFLEGLSWTEVTTKAFSCRYLPSNILFGNGGPVSFFNDDLFFLIGLLNSKVACEFFSVLAPTMNYGPDQVRNIPYKHIESPEIRSLVKQNIEISKQDWDSFETSWDFKEHPFVRLQKGLWDATAVGATMHYYYGCHPKVSCPLELCFMLWQGECNERRKKLKANEEELNRIFIDIYGLQDELTPEVDEKDITVRSADLQRDMRSFVSYAVGCMFGRYSLDVDGLVYAGGDFNTKYCRWMKQFGIEANQFIDENGRLKEEGWAGSSQYGYDGVRKEGRWITASYAPDTDNCIPITEERFFDDDIVARFAEFVKTVFGEETLEDNLRYVAESLGIKGSGTAREKIRQYFLKDFFADHCKVYQKRPIYWLFDTGKKNGFKALVYMHRWNSDTVGNVRVEYMHKLQRLYRNEINRLKENIENGEDIAKSQKRLERLTNQLKETEDFDAKIGMVVAAKNEIDLDDGVKVNYEKVQTGSDGKKYEIMAKI